MAKIPKNLDVPYCDNPVVVSNNMFWHQWCCDCELRHTYLFRVVRGKTPKDDKIEMYITRDDWATDAMKKIKRDIKE